MLKDRKALEEHLEAKSMRIIVKNQECLKLYDYMFTKYNTPKDLTADLISLRKSFSEVSEFVLFGLLDGLETIIPRGKSKIREYFTEQEIETYGNAQHETEKIEFPLTFKMIEVSYDQWIGKITINQLMELRKAQLINYNVNAQRTMQKIIRGDQEYYKIALNKHAVSQIEAAFQSRQFIPNTLTLNILQDSENDFYYDEATSTFVIKALKSFDISDGYHRYIAACQRKDKDPDFDYVMELRIINFSNDKVNQFIFQEDQKTKMKRVDSDSMNMAKAANIVVTKVNEDYRCNIQGLISRNEGLVSFSELADIVHYFYFKDVGGKENEKIMMVQATKHLVEIFNALTEYDTKYLTKKYSFKLLVTILYCFNMYTDKTNDEICILVEKTHTELEKRHIKKFVHKQMRKTLVNEIEKVIKECEFDV